MRLRQMMTLEQEEPMERIMPEQVEEYIQQLIVKAFENVNEEVRNVQLQLDEMRKVIAWLEKTARLSPQR